MAELPAVVVHPTPDEMKFVMPDIDPHSLRRYSKEWLNDDYYRGLITKEEKKERTPRYLGPAARTFTATGDFPVVGKVGQNKRLLVILPCSWADADLPAINVLFVIDTASPYTFLSQEAVKALQIPPEMTTRTTSFPVRIHSKALKVTNCYASPAESSFRHVNILGIDFFTRNELKLIGQWGDGLTRDEVKIVPS